MAKSYREAPPSQLFTMIALAALAYLGAAYLVADTGYPGGISEQARNLIIADALIILGLGGWFAVWRKRKTSPKSTGGEDRLIALAIIAVTQAGLWLLVQAFGGAGYSYSIDHPSF